MSQKKVDQYKEYKKNRAKILKREKMVRRIEMIAAALICAVLVGWLGYSAVQTRNKAAEENAQAPAAVEVDMNAYMDYVNTLPAYFSDAS
ncbi:MAG: hypothetical protein IJJ38_11210 [Lachnospiraceae bacterium]|nr:hypothetical protein [Lachnospiraceae bacterium]